MCCPWTRWHGTWSGPTSAQGPATIVPVTFDVVDRSVALSMPARAVPCRVPPVRPLPAPISRQVPTHGDGGGTGRHRPQDLHAAGRLRGRGGGAWPWPAQDWRRGSAASGTSRDKPTPWRTARRRRRHRRAGPPPDHRASGSRVVSHDHARDQTIGHAGRRRQLGARRRLGDVPGPEVTVTRASSCSPRRGRSPPSTPCARTRAASWAFSPAAKKFICPCHGSEYNGATGALLRDRRRTGSDGSHVQRGSRRGALRHLMRARPEARLARPGSDSGAG